MACNYRRRAAAARSSANGMTSIPEPGRSSPDKELHSTLDKTHAEYAALARRNDELELIIAASRLGFCVLQGETRRLRANSQFKAEFGWAPDAPIEWEDRRAHV